MLIGEILLQKQIITQQQLDYALQIQQEWKSSLGTILLSLGFINPLQLAETLAMQHQKLYYNPCINPPDDAFVKSIAKLVGEDFMRQKLMIPVSATADTIQLVMANPEDHNAVTYIESMTGKKAEIFVATDRDIFGALVTAFQYEYVEESVMGLFFRSPQESAMVAFTSSQLIVMYLLISLLFISAYFSPLTLFMVLVTVINIFYLLSLTFKLFASIIGARREIQDGVTQEQISQLKNEDMPSYTILLPMYKEPIVVANLIDSIKKMDYPISKLDVKILLEEDDDETLQALYRLRPPGHFKIIRVPLSYPKTKPKACNYGLLFSEGEFLTIYDAEDTPEPDQLKKVVYKFRNGPDNLICVQSALNYFNAQDNFLTKMFTLEYSYWFDYMLPGLEAMKLPIPLGGTSNHFKVKYLKEIGGWDPFNVTEDADLGLRANAHNLIVATINSTTYEEANSHYGNWIRQRSRWIKGYMQTYLVNMRHPLQLLRKVGLKSFLGFQLLIGGTFFSFLINPLMWIIFIVWLVLKPMILNEIFPPWLVVMSLFSLVVGNGVGIYLNMIAVFRRRLYWLTPYSLLNPIYWILHSIAAYRGLWQLFFKTHYWEKTVHGLTKKTT